MSKKKKIYKNKQEKINKLIKIIKKCDDDDKEQESSIHFSSSPQLALPSPSTTENKIIKKKNKKMK